MGEGARLGLGETWILFPALPQTSCVTSVKSFKYRLPGVFI